MIKITSVIKIGIKITNFKHFIQFRRIYLEHGLIIIQVLFNAALIKKYYINMATGF